MNKNVISIDSNKTAYDAAELMLENKVGSVVVVNNGTAIGIVTERDFMRVLTRERASPTALKVHQLMSQPVITIGIDATVEDAGALMSKHKIRRLPVVDKEKFVGIMTNRDLAQLSTFLLMKSEQRPPEMGGR